MKWMLMLLLLGYKQPTVDGAKYIYPECLTAPVVCQGPWKLDAKGAHCEHLKISYACYDVKSREGTLDRRGVQP